jgi:signal transduction histidine kinase
MQAAQLAAAGQSQAIQQCVASLSHELQHLAGALHPAMLDQLGLAVALRHYCAEFAFKHGIAVNCSHRSVSARLPGHTAATLYRIAEEALANVAKHAHAKQAWVTLSRTAKGIRLVVRDDGDGFDPAAVEPGSGLGFLAMRERLRGIGGSLSIRSRNGAGTEIAALAPLLPARNQPRAAVARDVVVDPLDQH